MAEDVIGETEAQGGGYMNGTECLVECGKRDWVGKGSRGGLGEGW